MLHLAVTTGSLTIALAIAFTPKGRSVVSSVWDWLKGLFLKKAPSSKESTTVILQGGSRKGTWFAAGYSKQREAIPPIQVIASQFNDSLKEFPPALGCERLPAPAFSVNLETLPAIPPHHLLASTINPSEPLQQRDQNIGLSDRRHVSKPVSRRKQTSTTGRKHFKSVDARSSSLRCQRRNKSIRKGHHHHSHSRRSHGRNRR
jgi:hypothetical protein